MYYSQLTCSVQPVNRNFPEKVRLKKYFWSIFLIKCFFSGVLISRCFGTHITSSFCFTASLLFTVLGTFSKIKNIHSNISTIFLGLAGVSCERRRTRMCTIMRSVETCRSNGTETRTVPTLSSLEMGQE